MKIEMTKEQVIEALEKEPLDRLMPGSWFNMHKDDATGAMIATENCGRCAVGAVLATVVDDLRTVYPAARAATLGGDCVPDTDEITGGYCTEEDLRADALSQLRHGYAMAALSFYFEGMCVFEAVNAGREDLEPTSADIDCARQACVEFVKCHFPAKMTIDINGASPVPGVQIVQEG